MLLPLLPLRRGSAARRTRPAFPVQPRLESLETRIVPYTTTGNAWPNPQVVTISFVPDGTVVGSNSHGQITSNLQSTFNNKFGSSSTWQNIVLQAAQSYAQQTNINFVVIPDSGAQTGSGPDQQGDPTMGDIRVAGYNFGNSNLGMAYMPPPANNFSAAGDIFFNTAEPFHIGSTYDLYSVAAHEIGHALGLGESTTPSAVMYGIYNGVKTGLGTDDINGIRAVYSGGSPRSYDQYGGSNNSFATAADITSSVSSITDTGVVTGLNIANTLQTEYFVVDGNVPTIGNSLTLQVQSQGLSLLAPTVTVYAADQQTVLASAAGTGEDGTTLTVTVNGLGEGNPIYIKVARAESTAFGTGAYALTLSTGIGGNPSVPLPNTTLANGNPLHAGGGLPLDTFGLTEDDAPVPAPVATGSTAARAVPAVSAPATTEAVAGTPGLAVNITTAVNDRSFLPPAVHSSDAGMPGLGGAAPGAFENIASTATFQLGTTGTIEASPSSFSSTAPGAGDEGTSSDGMFPVGGSMQDSDFWQDFFRHPNRTDGDEATVTDACFLDPSWMTADRDDGDATE
jgi:hypothetical protein